ncbi:MAG: hypothetical protein ABIL49_05180 [candidate division WOR-3 bacterium]
MKFLTYLYPLIIIYFLFIFSNHHKMISALNYVKTINNPDIVYTNQLKPASINNSIEKSITILYYILQMKQNKKVKTWLTEDPLKIYEIYRFSDIVGSCYNDAILFNFLAKMNELNSRLIEFASSDGLGGKGHTINEFYSYEYNKWVLIDVNLGIMFFDLNKIPLSAYEVRRIALSSKNVEDFLNKVVIISFNGKISKKTIYNEYRNNAIEMLVIEDDLMAKSYGRKIAYFIENLNCEYCVKFGRFLRSLFSPLNRIRIKDEFSPNIQYEIYFYPFQILFAIFISINIFFLSIILKEKIFNKL